MESKEPITICMICEDVKVRREWINREIYETSVVGRPEYSHGICDKPNCIRTYVGLSGLPMIVAEDIISRNEKDL